MFGWEFLLMLSRDSEDDFKKLLWQGELNPRVRCAFGNVYLFSRLTYFMLWQAGRLFERLREG